MRPPHLVILVLVVLAIGLGVGLGVGIRLGNQRNLAEPPKGEPKVPPQAPQKVEPKGDPKGEAPPLPKIAQGTLSLSVKVLLEDGKDAKGVLVTVLSTGPYGVAGKGKTLEPIGELGVFRGPLPKPNEVIAGTAAPPSGVSGSTDDKGEVLLKGLSKGRVQVLATVSSPTRREASKEVELPSPAITLTLAPIPEAPISSAEVPALPQEVSEDPLPKGSLGDVEGVVHDERGMSLAGVRVEAQVGSQRRPMLTEVTDGRGAFRLRSLPLGSLQLVVTHPGYAPLRVTPSGRELSEPLRLRLSLGAGVEGVVRERRLGHVPRGLRLTLVVGTERYSLPVDGSGRFRKTGLGLGDAVLMAQADEHVPLRRALHLVSADRPDGVSVRDLLLELEVAGTLRGTVRDERGDARGVTIVVFQSGQAGDGEVGRGVSDSRGEFRIGRLPAGMLQVKALQGGRQISASVELQQGAEGRVDLEFR